MSGVATSANGYILVLHRGAQPIMLFDSGGRFVRAWGDGLFSNGKVGGISPAGGGGPLGTLLPWRGALGICDSARAK